MIPETIQAWINKDTQFLQDCDKKRFDEYVAWFNDPATHKDFYHYEAITQVIQQLEGTKE